ncbi:MAG: CapA family protein [Coriobacteriia bacterium]|nr:CapA family protein [Coriobacteriia bacterium]
MNTEACNKKHLLVALTFALLVSLSSCTSNKPASYVQPTEFDLPVSSEVFTPLIGTPPEPEPEPQQRALVSFAGDCTLSNFQGASYFNSVYNNEGPAYFLSGVSDIFANDDLTVVNLEGPFTTATARIGKGPEVDEDGNLAAFWFKAPPEYVEILTLGSVEVCNLANNHTLDYGYEGYYETQEVLRDAGIDYFAYDETLVREVNGIHIGFFGFAYDADPDNIYWIIQQLYDQGAEVIVAYFHDGIEGYYYPYWNQISAAYTAIDYGASAVIMSHPHVIQGTEFYNGGFIAYSLGNFCYGGHTNPDDKDSMIIQLEFLRTDDGITCTPFIIPCSITSTPYTNDYRPMVLEGEEAQRVLDKIAEYSR